MFPPPEASLQERADQCFSFPLLLFFMFPSEFFGQEILIDAGQSLQTNVVAPIPEQNSTQTRPQHVPVELFKFR